MGFFDVLKNVASGKPGFETPSDLSSSSNQNQPEPSQPAQSGPKTIPPVRIERTECHNSGSNMRVECVIQNDSQKSLFFDRIFLLNTKVELDRELQPGQEWEFTVYDGPRPSHQNYTQAKLEFRDNTNDYFASLFTVDYRPEQDGTYSIERLHPAGQRDI